MLERIGELGDASITDALRPYLRDFDPIIAERTADIITGWTGEVTQADTKRLPSVAVPDVQELRTFEASRPVLVMEDGREITLRLLPLDAATNVARFVRLAKKGYYDGLTFHRVVPNFVIQGGSPGANEFVGDGPFTRDELTNRSHLRGTIGISTRGRDTGDAQIFVNLVDNIRLDHNYTIIADVVKGMDAVDDLLEGGRIARIRIP
jgi:cyclophilin family peptidyl-prolyl cis-trans isomerase